MRIANATSREVARRSRLPSPEEGLSRLSSGPVEPLLELQAALVTGVAVLRRCGRVRETDERENRLRYEGCIAELACGRCVNEREATGISGDSAMG